MASDELRAARAPRAERDESEAAAGSGARTAGAEATPEGLPNEVAEMIGRPCYPATADFAAESGYGWNTLAATENPNLLYWDRAVADELAGGPLLPLSTLSLWMRPHRWSPGADGEQVALQVHFDLKQRLGLPEAIMSDNALAFHEPVRPGDVISHRQVLQSVSGVKTTGLGAGRFWVIDVEYHNQRGELVGVESYTGFGYRRPEEAEPERTGPKKGEPKPGKPEQAGPKPGRTGPEQAQPQQERSETGRAGAGPAAVTAAGPVAADRAPDQPDLVFGRVAAGDAVPPLACDVTATTVVLGALASRDWRPMHHDHRFAVERNGTRDIFLNTPNQAAWFERFVTDWTGPRGRIGRLAFRMRQPVCPGDRMVISGSVTALETDDANCGWAELDFTLTVGKTVCSSGSVRVALPTGDGDNPWARRGDDWKP